MKHVLKTTLAAAAATLFAGCLSTPLAVVPSTDPVEQGRYTVLGSEVSGTDTQINMLVTTFGAHGSGVRRAIEDALEQAPGADALVRVAVEREFFPLIVFNFYKIRVTGTPVKLNKN